MTDGNGNATWGDLGTSVIDTTQLVDRSVKTAKIADLNVTKEKLAANAVTTEKLANNAVTIDKLANHTEKIFTTDNGDTTSYNGPVGGDVHINLDDNTTHIIELNVTAHDSTANVGFACFRRYIVIKVQ